MMQGAQEHLQGPALCATAILAVRVSWMHRHRQHGSQSRGTRRETTAPATLPRMVPASDHRQGMGQHIGHRAERLERPPL